MAGFYEIQQIILKNKIDFAGDNIQGNTTTRVPDLIYLLVSNHYATYYELLYQYSLNEFIDLLEICMVSLYNKNIVLNERNI